MLGCCGVGASRSIPLIVFSYHIAWEHRVVFGAILAVLAYCIGFISISDSIKCTIWNFNAIYSLRLQKLFFKSIICTGNAIKLGRSKFLYNCLSYKIIVWSEKCGYHDWFQANFASHWRKWRLEA